MNLSVNLDQPFINRKLPKVVSILLFNTSHHFAAQLLAIALQNGEIE